MKARVKATGEIINIADYARVTLDRCDSYGNPIELSFDEVEILQERSDNIDWEQRRYELAKAAMQGILSDEEEVRYACSEADYKKGEKHTVPKGIARFAIACADALINELKGD
jgi:hypothetical protein